MSQSHGQNYGMNMNYGGNSEEDTYTNYNNNNPMVHEMYNHTTINENEMAYIDMITGIL